MKIIYKYELKQTPEDFELCISTIPNNYQILDINFQGNKIYIWALVETKSNNIIVNGFYAVPTGQNLDPDFIKDKVFWKTIYNMDRSLVYHIWRIKNGINI